MIIKKNLISVIGSSFGNNPLEISKTIDSVLNQSYKFIEFIVVIPPYKNNLEVFKKYKNKVKVIKTTQLFNLAKSLNIALNHANGEFIARIDFDDVFFKNKLKKQIQFLKKRKDISILGTGYVSKNNLKFFFFPSNGFFLKVYAFFFNPLCHPTVIIRKKIFEKIRYNKEFEAAEDLELWLSFIANKNKIYNLRQALILYDRPKYLRNYKNFFYNYKARCKYSKKIFGFIFGNINIFLFYIFHKYIFNLGNNFKNKFL